MSCISYLVYLVDKSLSTALKRNPQKANSDVRTFAVAPRLFGSAEWLSLPSPGCLKCVKQHSSKRWMDLPQRSKVYISIHIYMYIRIHIHYVYIYVYIYVCIYIYSIYILYTYIYIYTLWGVTLYSNFAVIIMATSIFFHPNLHHIFISLPKISIFFGELPSATSDLPVEWSHAFPAAGNGLGGTRGSLGRAPSAAPRVDVASKKQFFFWVRHPSKLSSNNPWISIFKSHHLKPPYFMVATGVSCQQSPSSIPQVLRCAARGRRSGHFGQHLSQPEPWTAEDAGAGDEFQLLLQARWMGAGGRWESLGAGMLEMVMLFVVLVFDMVRNESFKSSKQESLGGFKQLKWEFKRRTWDFQQWTSE